MNYLIALGSNIESREDNLQQAIQSITDRCGAVRAVSSVYDTPPLGFNADTNFLNQVVHLHSVYAPFDLLQILLKIEVDMGRIRQAKAGYASRIIDLDILMADDLIFNSDQLQIPHPRMSERRFVLEPAAEIAPQWRHPILNHTISEMLALCTDESTVNRV